MVKEVETIKRFVSPASLISNLYSAMVESAYRDKTMLNNKAKRAVILKLPEGKSEKDSSFTEIFSHISLSNSVEVTFLIT